MSTEGDNFFSRWSRRKVQVRSGETLAPEPQVLRPAAAASPVVAKAPAPLADSQRVDQPTQAPSGETDSTAAPAPTKPALTLEDVARLTPESDFSSFVARGVSPEVRNAAVKKLFADPHFNVMDGLDIYIDDYTKPSPLSVADMGKMVGAQFLKLVDDPNDRPKAPTASALSTSDRPDLTPESAPAEDAHAQTVPPEDASASEPVLQASANDLTEPTLPQDDHADLQLQPDHAPGPQGPGRGAG